MEGKEAVYGGKRKVGIGPGRLLQASLEVRRY
jgi:hypothetical protein